MATKRNTAERFNITPKQLREWIKKKTELKSAPPAIRRLNIEDDLKTWVKSLRSRQKIVSRYMVKTKANQLAKQSHFLSLYPTINECKWSNKWVDGFMHRNNFSNRRCTTIAQRLPEDLEPKRDEFLSNILYHRMRYNYPLALIGNMDETPLAFDMPSNYTLEETGAQTVGICTTSYEKSNFTGIVVRANPSGYMNGDEMIFWIENIWNRRASLSINPRSLLVLDAFSGHLTDSVKNRFNEKNTNMAVIPEGLTKKLQPLDCCSISTAQDGTEEDLMFNYDWVNNSEARNRNNEFIYANEDSASDDENCDKDTYYDDEMAEYVNSWD
ncbi:5357_t:CDS:2 [Scutellospora calospora]|uniref:5357_t:CDS:1 n=1 Tax=Scutellospora calospora TaxID=85575 RepID=A0ACA9L8U9_9GLOM|nr:5357_t:CDS:2 [Scutellospora calospora]